MPFLYRVFHIGYWINGLDFYPAFFYKIMYVYDHHHIIESIVTLLLIQVFHKGYWIKKSS